MKKGDMVYLKSKEDFNKEFGDKLNSTGEIYVFDTLNLSVEQINVICPKLKYEVLCVDSDGDIKLRNLPGSYPPKVVKSILKREDIAL